MREKLKIFDENRSQIGIADREEIHKKGHWHETFHCWFVGKQDGTDYIYFQKRCDKKKDFPTLLDITAAGHIMFNESVSDGIREVKEELGIDLHIEELLSLGIIEDCIETGSFIDRELGNVYLYHMQDTDEFTLQKDEVSGIVKTQFNNFSDLCLGEKSEIEVEGFEVNEFEKRISIKKKVSLSEFVPHQKVYLESVVKLIAEKIK
jgi:isopentenyldiphosphate isomerase